MKLYKRNGVYHYKFMNKGRRFRGTTDLSNLKDATTAANKIRNAVVLGDLGILERGPAPSLKAFIEKQFLPYVVSRHAEKPKTLDYYKYGAGQLAGSKIGSARLDSITDKDIAGYIEEHCDWSASGINQGLRTLRRAMNLAYAWGVIGRRLAVRLCAGEKQRTRVLTVEEERAYLGHCREPWRTMATVLIELGLRPGEAFRLKAQDVLFGEFTLRISGGKSKAAKRELPLTDAAYTALEAWWKSIGSPKDGWMFPSPSREGKPYAQQRAYDWHHAALKAFSKIHSKCQPGNEWSESAKSPYEWLIGRDTGISSRTIYAAITGCPTGDYDIPHDPDDFGRCYRLLELFPNWKAGLHKVAERFPKWKPFIAAWDELTALYEEEAPSGRAPKLYDRMRELRREA